jgi:hypothetical protein
VFDEVMRVPRPGGVPQSADIANGRPLPEEARHHIDLWNAGRCRVQAGGRCSPRAGFVDIEVGDRVDTFAGAGGEANARALEIHGYPFRAVKR